MWILSFIYYLWTSFLELELDFAGYLLILESSNEIISSVVGCASSPVTKKHPSAWRQSTTRDRLMGKDHGKPLKDHANQGPFPSTEVNLQEPIRQRYILGHQRCMFKVKSSVIHCISHSPFPSPPFPFVHPLFLPSFLPFPFFIPPFFLPSFLFLRLSFFSSLFLSLSPYPHRDT